LARKLRLSVHSGLNDPARPDEAVLYRRAICLKRADDIFLNVTPKAVALKLTTQARNLGRLT
jgi:hypothetical protein